ncbi:hypothetical protein [Pleomorphovibrio marinus]|uniref:hypothetical protein n=1 Tax=Pleomorphovibrio marinus TaxID=2164132 RepID=UPI000E0BE509|nr:hypothetical protein [Pleomorphovibrio marinus]
MNAVNEGVELLDSLGINREVQQLFSEVLREDASGRLIADYRDGNGKLVDREIHGISTHKLSSCGILQCSPALPENVRALYISDAVMQLVFMVQRKVKRRDFAYSAFLATGARLDKALVLAGIDQYPKGIKIYTVFCHSLLGRIRDCKVQHWVKGLDCRFRIEGNKVVALFKGKEFWMSVGEFSLRNHLRQVGVRQTVTTIKPVIKQSYNFNCLW